MELDENVAAFGLFQLSFANLTQQLAASVFYIRRLKEPDLKFEMVFKCQFSELRKALKRELKRFNGQSLTEMDVQSLRHACATVGGLLKWRNARAHPRVQLDDNGITIYDWRTRKQLTINRDECVEKIHEAIKFTVLFEQHTGSLLRQLESKKRVAEMLDEIFKTVEDH
jgi:hypothetical protein